LEFLIKIFFNEA